MLNKVTILFLWVLMKNKFKLANHENKNFNCDGSSTWVAGSMQGKIIKGL